MKISWSLERAKLPGVVALSISSLFFLTAMAADSPSVERGKELFNGTTLGTNGKSCGKCHPGGKGVEKAGSYNDEDLGDIINKCIRGALEGKALDEDSTDMKSLVLYIRSLAGESPETK